MKQAIHLTLLLLSTGTVYGQIEKGQGLLTGAVSSSFQRETFGEGRGNQFQAGVSVGYGTFIRPHVLVGAEVSLGVDRSGNQGGGNGLGGIYSQSLSVAPFARYYWQFGKLLAYVGGGVSLAGSRSGLTHPTDPSEEKNRTFSADLSGQAGLVYRLSDRVGAEVYARSGSLPVVISSAGVGLVLYTGARRPLATGDTLTRFSQLGRGRVVLSAGFATNRTRQMNDYDSSQTNQTDITSRTNVAVGVGYFIRERTQIGVDGSYSLSRSSRFGGASSGTFAVSPFVKHYLNRGILTPYLRGSLLWLSNSPTYSAYLSGGLAYLPGNRFIIEAELIGIGGSYARNSFPSGTGTDRFYTHWNASLFATLRPNITVAYAF